jgi:hypothetical protein
MKLIAVCGLVVVICGLYGCGPGANEQRRSEYIAAHPEMSSNVRSLIQSGSVAPGMTKDQVLAAWGSPPADCSSWRSNLMEIWDYCHHPGRTLVVFDQNGRVSKLQGE